MFHIQFKTHNTENYMWEVDNFIFHSITQSFRLEGISSDHLVQPCLAQAESTTVGCPGPRPVELQVSPQSETPHHLWATYLLLSIHQFLLSLTKFGY